MLTELEIRMIKADWERVLPIASTAATLFYERLFDLDSGLRPLFAADLSEQKVKLMRMIGTAVGGLEDFAALVAVVRKLGQRHVAYGVVPAHYATVGDALLWTLKAGIGAEFDVLHEATWGKLYKLLAETMQAGAAAPPRKGGSAGTATA